MRAAFLAICFFLVESQMGAGCGYSRMELFCFRHFMYYKLLGQKLRSRSSKILMAFRIF